MRVCYVWRLDTLSITQPSIVSVCVRFVCVCTACMRVRLVCVNVRLRCGIYDVIHMCVLSQLCSIQCMTVISAILHLYRGNLSERLNDVWT